MTTGGTVGVCGACGKRVPLPLLATNADRLRIYGAHMRDCPRARRVTLRLAGVR